MDVADAYAKLPNGNGETEASKRIGSFGGVIDDMDNKFMRHPKKQCYATQAELDAARNGGYGTNHFDHDPLLEYATHTRTFAECKRLCITTTHCKAFEFKDGGTYTTDAKRCGLYYACSSQKAWSQGTSYVKRADTTGASISTYVKIKSRWKCDHLGSRVIKQTGVAAVDDCYKLCLITPNCHYFSYRTEGDRFCVGCSEPSFVSEATDSKLSLTTYSVHTPSDPALVGLSGGKNKASWRNLPSPSQLKTIADGTKIDIDVLVEGTGKIAVSFLYAGTGYTYIEFLNLKTPTWLSPESIVVKFIGGSSDADTTAINILIVKFVDSTNMKLYRIRASLNGVFVQEPTLGELQRSWINSQSYTVTKKSNAIQKYGPIEHWDLSEVTNLKYVFYQTALNPDISRWVVSTVTDMHGSK